MSSKLHTDPFGIRATLPVLHLHTRRLGVVLLVGVALLMSPLCGWELALPGLYRPPPLSAEVLAGRWCAAGTLVSPPPRAYCLVPLGPGGRCVTSLSRI